MSAMPEHSTGTCASGDVTLHYRHFRGPMPMTGSHIPTFGAGGTPMLIVHGLSYFSYDWIGIAAALCGDRDVVAMDMRGFGDSTWSADGKYGLDDFAGDMHNLLDHLEWPEAVVMGHSMGGRNATCFAAGHPDRVEKLVLVDFSPVNAPEGGKRVMNVVAATPDVFADVDAALAYFGQDPHSPRDSAVRTRMENYLRRVDGGFAIKRDTVFRDRFRKQRETGRREPPGADMWERLGAVRCPILVVRGTRSDMFAEETVPKVKEANANVTLVELDTGHNVGGEDPDGLIRAVEKFL